MAEKGDRKTSVLGGAGRTAVKLLRQTRTRAKLGSLHLPINLQGFRRQAIVLPAPKGGDSQPDSTPDPVESPSLAHTRALRVRLGATERRVARLRHALERERQARALAGAALRDPRPLIEQLVADLAALPPRDQTALRETIAAILAAYGFQVAAAGDRPASTTGGEAAPVTPGWDRARIEALTVRLLAAHPEIGGRRYLHLSLEALARQGSLTAAQLAASADLTSPLARHRLRLALEAIAAAGVARRDGPRFTLLHPGETANT
ncbi:MAG TPA: hypothetical protein VNL71_10525 [Chloroflexota bacterium]|nr:hypothetical protein [Chloroflexota bacterium]